MIDIENIRSLFQKEFSCKFGMINDYSKTIASGLALIRNDDIEIIWQAGPRRMRIVCGTWLNSELAGLKTLGPNGIGRCQGGTKVSLLKPN